MTQLGIWSRDYIVEFISDKRKWSSLVGGSAKEKSFEVLGCPWDYIFEELFIGEFTLKWS